MTAFEAHMTNYRAEHRTFGCRVSHMIGVPMIVTSVPLVFVYWPAAIALFVVGWSFQLASHRYFEHNQPVLAADPKNPRTYVAALMFVAQEWSQVVSRRRLSEAAPAAPHAAPSGPRECGGIQTSVFGGST